MPSDPIRFSAQFAGGAVLQEVGKILQESSLAANRAALKGVLGDVIRRTLPNRPGENARRLTSANVRALKKRIRLNVLGDNKLATEGNPRGGLRTAAYNPYNNKPVAVLGRSSMPLVIWRQPKGRGGRKRQTIKPLAITTATAALQAIRAGTKPGQTKSGAFRLAKPTRGRYAASALKWASKSAWQGASKMLEKHAGQNIYGWAAAAEKIDLKEFRRAVLADGVYHNKGSAKMHEAGGRLAFGADNPNTPDPLQGYTQRVINSGLQRMFDFALANAEKREEKALKRKLKALNVNLS